MAEITPIPVQPLDYASPPPARNAEPRRMFKYLLPAGICIGAALGSLMIEANFPEGDSRDFQGPMCVLVTAPLGLVFGIMGIREAFRPRGLRALLWGVCWNIVVALGPWVVLDVIVKLGLLKHT